MYWAERLEFVLAAIRTQRRLQVGPEQPGAGLKLVMGTTGAQGCRVLGASGPRIVLPPAVRQPLGQASPWHLASIVY